LTRQSRFFYGYINVAICFLGFMAVIGLTSSFVIFFKPIVDELGWSRAAVSAAFSINLMVAGVAGILIGVLNDKFGPRVVLSLCCLVSAAGFFFVSRMHSLGQYYLFFGLICGIGGNVFVPSMSTVARWFVRRRSLMSGLTFSGAGFGMLVFPPIINSLLGVFDWRFSLVILSLFIFIIFVLTVFLIKRDPAEVGQTAYGADFPETSGHRLTGKSISLTVAVRTKAFWLFFVALLFYGFCYFSMQVHIAPHVTDMGISSGGAAVILAMIGGATIVGQIGLGSIGDKYGNKGTFIIGLVCILLAFITIIFARELWAFLLFAAFLGLAFGTCSTQESPIVAWLFGLASHSSIMGILVFGVTIGAAVGPWLFGYLFDLTGSYQIAFYIAGILAITAIILTLFLKQILSKDVVKTKTV
jgi:MFS family permease